MNGTLGVLGGMGALASAEFIRTVYEYNADEVEQQSPVTILCSDPAFPDRTEALLNRQTEALVGRLTHRLDQLYRMGSSKIVVCCVTLHFALPQLPASLRGGIVSLIDTIIDLAAESSDKYLLLCSTGVRAARLFENHERWGSLKPRVIFPDDADQQMIHRSLYKYKVSPGEQPLVPHLDGLLQKYRADSFIAGCTELHMMTRHLLAESPGSYRIIDPLLAIAMRLPQLLAQDSSLADEAVSGRLPERFLQESPVGL
jgi:aspartate racemase